MLGTILGTKDITMKQKDMVPALIKLKVNNVQVCELKQRDCIDQQSPTGGP